ncbi:MAG: acyltransferase family protein [Pirellulaceae bacterium]
MDKQNPTAVPDIPDEAPVKTTRLMSLDALRGFDMFWIIGADALVQGLRQLSDNPALRKVSQQLEHCEWAGFRFEDLIFPLFIFIVGVSLVFSLSRTIEQQGRRAAIVRILRRAALMYLLGVFYYGGFSTSFDQIRLLGVLQRIAICYLCAGLIFCFWGLRGRVIWCGGLLVGYWLVMSFVPVPGGVAGNFDEGQNLANWVDKEYLPLRKWDGDHDPEGLLSTLPAVANCLIGVFAGMLLRDANRQDWKKVAYLVAAGLLMSALGWLWDLQFPVIKKIWTSSFVLVACGYSCLLLSLFYLVIDVAGWRFWAQPFVWIGMNPITIYMLDNLVDIPQIAKRFVGGDLNAYFGDYGQLVVAIVGLLITFAIARFLYRRKIFLRL